jgi:AraC-like DNA-binding protein
MLLYFSALTILLSVILAIYNWRLNKTTVFLSLFFIIFSLYGITHHFTVYGNSVINLALFFNNISPFFLLVGPFLYFYVRGTIQDKQGLKWQDSIHFLPFSIHLIGITPYLLSSFEFKKNIAFNILNDIDSMKIMDLNIFFTVPQSFLIRTVLFLTYVIYLIGFVWLSYSSENKKNPLKQNLITYRWLLFLLLILLFLIVNFFLVTISFLTESAIRVNQYSKMIHFIAGISYLILSISLLLFPKVLYGIPESVKINLLKNNEPKNNEIILDTQINENDLESFHELTEHIKEYLNTDKPFLNPEFSLSDISLALNVPQHHVAYCINNILNVRFAKLKSELRIAHAKELLQKGKHYDFTINGIGQSSGFSTRSNFYNAFKIETGLTPTQFLNQVKAS